MKELGKFQGKETLPVIYRRFAKQSFLNDGASHLRFIRHDTCGILPRCWLEIQRNPSEDDIYVGWSQWMKMMMMNMVI